jgi:prepilin-type N-terminal cleavage/methylation domain-containing protein
LTKKPDKPGSRAFTLIEVLAAMVIIAISAGSIGLARSAFETDGTLARLEALKLSQWLTNRMTASNRSGRPFSLVCPGNVPENFVLAEWQNPLQTGTYTSLYGCGFIRYQGSAPRSLYSPQWNSLVPTITIKVSRSRAEYFVVVSQHGRVRTTPKP